MKKETASQTSTTNRKRTVSSEKLQNQALLPVGKYLRRFSLFLSFVAMGFWNFYALHSHTDQNLESLAIQTRNEFVSDHGEQEQLPTSTVVIRSTSKGEKSLQQHRAAEAAHLPSLKNNNNDEDADSDRSSSSDTTTMTLSHSLSNIPSNMSDLLLSDMTTIRRWGCNRTETPFIFVHIGKAGGGGVRARVAASAQNYTRTKWWRVDDQSYYPIRRSRRQPSSSKEGEETFEEVTERGTFCNWAFSGFNDFDPTGGNCVASTPIGQAIGCPEVQRNCNIDVSLPQSEHVAYAGHNLFGHDMHWVPHSYLEAWWDQHWARRQSSDGSSDASVGTKSGNVISQMWKTLDGIHPWCDVYNRPLANMKRSDKTAGRKSQCAKQLQNRTDTLALEHMSKIAPFTTSADRGRAWASLYASLPTLRVVVVRDPYSWLMSKFSWHFGVSGRNLTCDNVQEATYGSGDPNVLLGIPEGQKQSVGTAGGPGWARRFALAYIYYFCGTDCFIRHYQQKADLEEIAVQSELNLRNSYAVVGLLQETDEFYQMVTARVDYMDTRLNPRIKGKKHMSGKSKEILRCKARFKDPAFQEELKAASPEIALLDHLYKVAVEVNRFQTAALKLCSAASFANKPSSSD